MGIGPASETDVTRSLKSLDRLRKALREQDLPWQIRHGVYLAFHDGMGIYEYLDSGGITPIIAINPRATEAPAPCGTAERVNAEGIPICPAGLLMRRHTVSHKQHRITYNGPIKRPTHRNGEHLWLAHTDECPHGVLCQPETKMGPIVESERKRVSEYVSRRVGECKRLALGEIRPNQTPTRPLVHKSPFDLKDRFIPLFIRFQHPLSLSAIPPSAPRRFSAFFNEYPHSTGHPP